MTKYLWQPPQSLIIIIILSLFAACENTEPTQQSVVISGDENIIQLHSEFDTIIANGDTITFVPNSPVNKKEKIWSTKFVEDSTKHKDDSGYVLTLQNGEQIALYHVDNEENEVENLQYGELSDISKINHWLVQVSHYEWGTYELVDKADGTITELIDYPVLSPHHDKIIVCKQDLESGLEEFNGIEFLRVKNNKVIPAWTREFTMLGLSDPKWIDNDTVIFRRVNAKTHKVDFVKATFK